MGLPAPDAPLISRASRIVCLWTANGATVSCRPATASSARGDVRVSEGSSRPATSPIAAIVFERSAHSSRLKTAPFENPVA